MNVLVYCIMGHPHPSGLESLRGIGDEIISLVETDGLMAAVSRIVTPDATPNLKRILHYQKIIEWFHNDSTIIPMRYGCLVAEESEVVRILKEHGDEYKRLLGELEGCEEMGIRILSSEFDSLRRDSTGPRVNNFVALGKGISPGDCQANQSTPDLGNKPSPHPGQAYLAVRKAHYVQEESINQENEALIEAYRNVFAGLFVKCKKEGPSTRHARMPVDNTLLFSLYFLVPKYLVNTFRLVFKKIPSKDGQKILLSGPWPPYNFAHASTQAGERP